MATPVISSDISPPPEVNRYLLDHRPSHASGHAEKIIEFRFGLKTSLAIEHEKLVRHRHHAAKADIIFIKGRDEDRRREGARRC
jgi:hypothetical protein